MAFVLQAEAAAKAEGFIGGWSEGEHLAALRDESVAYRLIVADGKRSVGYAIVRGVGSEHGSLELKRLVVSETGQGYGRRALRLVKRLAFAELGAHRLWLDVFTHNARARRLHESEGFVPEGILRECVRRSGGYASLVVMSLLESEYRTREAL